jgi:hypothetical protein
MIWKFLAAGVPSGRVRAMSSYDGSDLLDL